MQESEDTRLLIRYLLDDLSEGEQERVEDRYASDEAFYFKLLATEDELIDSYVLGFISHHDRAKFEQVYLSNPHRREKVESNRALLQAVDNMLAPLPLHRRLIASLRRTISNPGMSLSYSFAGLLLIATLSVVLCLLLWERTRLHNELEQAKSEWIQKEKQYEQQIAALSQPSASPQPSPASPQKQELTTDNRKEVATPLHGSPVVAFALQRDGRTRGGQAGALKPFVIRRGAILVELTVAVVPNDYPHYRVFLERPGGQKVWDETVVPKESAFSTKKIVVNVPAAFFQHRDYILKVTGDSPEEILAFHHIAVINQNLPAADNDRAPDGKTGETRREK